MRVLVTGGAGFIGSHLTEYLVQRGNKVVVLDNLSTGKFENIEHIKGIECIIDSTLNEEIVRDLVKDVDVVFHLAATVGVNLVINNPIQTIVNNIRGTETVLEETCRYRRPLLITSTSEVYGKSMKEVFEEDDDQIIGPPHRHRWCYAASKAIDEFLALAYWKEKRHPVYIVRLFNIVGPRQTGQYGMVLPNFIMQALKGEPLRVFGDGMQTRSFAYVGDIVPALVQIMERPDLCGKVFNLGNDKSVRIIDLAKKVIEVVQSPSVINLIPYEEAYPEGYEDMRHRVPCLNRIRQAIGYEPKTPLETIISIVAEYLRKKVK
ncbi:MAG TPA: NAD-dependent epimerase/dehydratase family protein [Candidatus Hydrogenedens sp.]|nr:NAD-dependent epimerase/dehydratase family protein [Candidatus Hydrogenedens sp.]HOL19122.1 NAD-dependent epimerase/dehydratase family protein [Candidatus Hydrogenedens sp.]HPP58060.1 NAD-dependent epimerase/dehydratase family protein [Candidatus Hydrogenedens sp.]